MELFKGHNGQIELTDLGVTIVRKGLLGLMTQGLKGEKRIPFESISAVQFKKAGFFSGYIQFSILGGVEARGGVFDATKDENTVMFTNGAQAKDFERLRSLVEERIASARRPVQQPPAVSVADELAKLAALKTQGILTDEEFSAQKAILLGT